MNEWGFIGQYIFVGIAPKGSLSGKCPPEVINLKRLWRCGTRKDSAFNSYSSELDVLANAKHDWSIMKPLELAEKYMNCVFNTGDLEELRMILSDRLKFRGPFFNFDSADDYVNSLRKDPPEDFEYKIIKSYVDNSSACLVYQFSKPGVSTTMTQTFETNRGKICSILLIFDTGAFQPE